MLLKFLKIKTPTMRYRSRLKFSKSLFYSFKGIIKTTLSNSGRNDSGKITVYSKKHKNKHKNFKCSSELFNNIIFYVKWINFNAFTKNKFSFLQTSSGVSLVLPCVYGTPVGTLLSLKHLDKTPSSIIIPGFPCLLRLLPYFLQVSNIYLKITEKYTYAKSSGTFCKKLKTQKKEKLLKILMPSKQTKFLKLNSLCIIGKNSQSHKNIINTGKAGCSSWYGIKPKVRGVAMNPVDHPNGGRTKSCSPEKSPWGWVAKFNK